MAIRDKIRERSASYLEPGEEFQYGFPATAGITPWAYMLFGLILAFFARQMIVVVTDRSILILRAGALETATPKSLVSRLPRATRLGELRGVWGKIFEGTDWEMFVHRRFHDDVRAADQRRT